MKNILFIGPYKDSNGLGHASRRYIDALIQKENINLCLRPVFFTNSSINNDIDIKHYDKFNNNIQPYYDYVIQHGFPEMFVYDKGFGKNIGIVEIETRNISRSGWINRINLLDEVYINSINGINSLYAANNIKTSLKLVPEPFQIEEYNNKKDPFFVDKENNKPFIFYTIGQYTEKKNIKGIILAYLLEFNQQDNVKLFIKTNSYTMELQNLDNIINHDISIIKKSIRKKNCADINIVSGYISDHDIIRLHQSADCYVNAARADGCGPCAIGAMLSGKVIINTKNIGSSSYFNSGNALMVDSVPVSVYSPEFINENILTINEEWDEPNIIHLQQQMRAAYNMSKEQKDKLINNYNHNIFTSSYFNNTL